MVLRRLLLVLSVLTLLGLYANAFWMTRVLRVDGHGPDQVVTAVDDRGEGGRSEGQVLPDGEGWRLRCEIRAGYEWPFCDMQVALGAEGQGLDLSAFELLRLRLVSSGPAGPVPLRVFLRNRDPAYAGSGQVADLKPHELVLDPSREAQTVDVPLTQFMVASWWSQQRPLPLKLSGPQLNEVVLLSFTTGGGLPPGRYEIHLQQAELRGHWISAASFRLGLIGLWMFSLLGYLLWEGRQSRQKLAHSIRRKLALQRAHAALQAHSEDLAALAHRDALTGVSNRMGLEHDLHLLIRSQEDMLFPLALVFADIDRFKLINDQHGHEVGDEVLRRFAATLKSNLQREDLVARWGGEEFVLLMPQTRADEAVVVAERLRECLRLQEWPAGLVVTASFGVAQCESASEVDASLRAADRAMYQAKAQGRDRVLRAGP
jgi:diguanylate cyclase (GGDEF)-like protein